MGLAVQQPTLRHPFFPHTKVWGESRKGGGKNPTYIYNITYIIYRRDLGGVASTDAYGVADGFP